VNEDETILDEIQNYYPTGKQSIVLMLWLFLLTFVASIPYAVISLLPDVFDGPLYMSIGLLIGYVGSFIWTIYIAKKNISKEGSWTLKWKVKKVPIGIYLLALVATFSLIVLIDFTTSLIPMPDFVRTMFEDALKIDVFSFITVVIAAPILEEMLFRGVILQGFLKNYNPRKAIILSSVLFGVIHLNPWQAIAAITMGIFIGWLYVKTKSILPGIVIHFIVNLTGFTFAANTTGAKGSWFDLIDQPITIAVALVLAATIVFVVVKKLSTIFRNMDNDMNKDVNEPMNNSNNAITNANNT
jgi:membrane protease YdiL (CAAX protease family)